MTETVECQGNEAKLEDCQIKYKTNHGVCKPEQSIVSVTCVHDTFASCEDNEVPWKQKCYSVYFNRSRNELIRSNYESLNLFFVNFLHQHLNICYDFFN